MTVKKSVLGRGLDALLEGAGNESGIIVGKTSDIPLDKIIANPYQPRTEFDEESLQELTHSIKTIGIIQPITVRMVDQDRFQLISGERRLRASRLAGLDSIPAYVRLADDQGMLEMALVENLQREDLDPIEIALSFVRLLDECNLTQEELSERVGKKRSTISNYVRLLKLPPEIQSGIRNKEITMGHARALINIEDIETQTMIYNQIIRYDFSVRKVEEVVREILEEETGTPVKERRKRFETPQEFIQLKAHLTKFFKTDVEFKMNNHGKGKIVIPFGSEEDLERIVGILDDFNK
ncbi:MAG: ParB/RepB/Spo0J family partition protein [Bacteroidia bacterium]|nr:ParB/RepB/Spo0J family partition protein [Bacteroidia bacterium]